MIFHEAHPQKAKLNLCLVIMGQPIICFFVKLLLASYWSMCMMHFHDLKIKLQIDLAIPSLIIKLGDGYCFFLPLNLHFSCNLPKLLAISTSLCIQKLKKR